MIVRRVPEFFIFYLQARAVAFGEEEGILSHRMEPPFNLLYTVGIGFCPWWADVLMT